MEHWQEEHIKKKEAEREQRKAEFESELTKLWQLMVGNVNPLRKPRWSKDELIAFFNYHLRTPFFCLLDSYRMVRGEYIIELVNVRTFRLRVHYYQHYAIPTELFISAKRPDRVQTAHRLLHTLKDALVKKLEGDNPGLVIGL